LLRGRFHFEYFIHLTLLRERHFEHWGSRNHAKNCSCQDRLQLGNWGNLIVVGEKSPYHSLTGRVGRNAETIQKRATGKLAGLITGSRLMGSDRDCSWFTGKPEVIPETESLRYLQKSQGRPRRRILTTRLVLTSLLVCAKCAQQACTRLLRTAPISRQRQMQVAETAGGLGVARVWHHTQNPPGFGPWGFDSPSRHHCLKTLSRF